MNTKITWFASVWVGLGATLGPAHAQDMAEGGSMAPALDPFITEAFDLGLVTGFAVAVVKDDEVVYLRGFGWADVKNERKVTPDTVFYIASSTKAFTGTAAAILDQRGELDLDAPLSVLAPALRLHEGLSADRITLRDLITHTHGVTNSGAVTFRSAFSGEQTHELLMELLPRHEPAESGRDFVYGNIGYNIASLVMFEALGKGWKDILAAEIFEPLGMRSTTGYVSRIPEARLAMPYMISPTGFKRLSYVKGDSNMHAAGGLVTTVGDLSRWLRANLNEGRIGNESVLNASAIDEAKRTAVDQADTFQQFQRTGYGLGWHTGSYDGDAFTHCFGSFSGFFSHVSFMPDRGIGVTVLVNTSATGMFLSDLVSRYIYDRLLEKPDTNKRYREEMDQIKAMSVQIRERIAADAKRRAARPQTLPHPLEAYAGLYENADYGQIEFSVVEGDRLEATMGRLRSDVEVYDNERNMLRVELLGGGMVVAFDFEDSDQATALEFRGLRFDRVSPPPAAPQTTTTDDTAEGTDSIIELSDDEMELREAFNKVYWSSEFTLAQLALEVAASTAVMMAPSFGSQPTPGEPHNGISLH